MPRRNIIQVRLNDRERAHAAGEASRAGVRLAEWARGAVKATLFQRVVLQLEQVRNALTLARPNAVVTLSSDGVVRVVRGSLMQDRGEHMITSVTMNDKRELLEATAEWLIGEARKGVER